MLTVNCRQHTHKKGENINTINRHRLRVQYRIYYYTHQIDSFITIECENDNISITNSYIDYKSNEIFAH